MTLTTTTRYAIEFEYCDLGVPGLIRRQLLTGRGRSGADEVVTFASLEQAQNAAAVQRALTGVLRATVLPVTAAR